MAERLKSNDDVTMNIMLQLDRMIQKIEKDITNITCVAVELKKCFQGLTLNSGLYAEFALKCITYLATSASVWKEQGVLERRTVASLVSIVRECHKNIIKSKDAFSSKERLQICRCVYNIFAAAFDVEFSDGLQIVDLLILSINDYEAAISNNDEGRSTYLNCIGPIARNSFVLLWNTTIKVELLPSEAISLRLKALSILCLAKSDFTRFWEKAVDSALNFFASLEMTTSHVENSCIDLANFIMKIFDLFRLHNSTELDVSSEEGKSIFLCFLKLLHITARCQLKCMNFSSTSILVKKARIVFRTPTSVALLLDVMELNSYLCSLVINECKYEEKTMNFIKTAVNNDSEYLKNCTRAKCHDLDQQCFAMCLNITKLHLNVLVDKFAEDAIIVKPLGLMLPLLTNLMFSMLNVVLVEIREDAVLMLNSLLRLYSCHLKLLHRNGDDVTPSALVALDVVRECHNQISKLKSSRRWVDIVEGFINVAFHFASVLYNAQMYVLVASFVSPLIELFFTVFNGKDQAQSEKYWLRISVLIVCLYKDRQFLEALQILARCMANNIGADTETMKLWVSIKRRARREGDGQPLTVTTKQFVAPYLGKTSTCRTRLKLLLRCELQMLTALSKVLVDETYCVLLELSDMSDDLTEKASYLILMARIKLGQGQETLSFQHCKEAVGFVIKSTEKKSATVIFSYKEQCILVQADFLQYNVQLMKRYSQLEEMVSNRKHSLEQLKQMQRLEAERNNVVESAKEDDTNTGEDACGIAAYQISTLHEELSSLALLDSCLAKWKIIVDSDYDLADFISDFTSDLRSAAEIYSNARVYGNEILAWELFLKLTKQQKKWSDYADGVARLCTTLARLGFFSRAQLLLDAAAQRLHQMPKSKPEEELSSVSLLLSRSELLLMESHFSSGWKCLQEAFGLLKRMKRLEQVMISECQALCLKSRYCELPPSVLAHDLAKTVSPIDVSLNAFQCCRGLLKLNASDRPPIAFHLKQRLITCIFDTSLRLANLHVDIGSLREARCYLEQKLWWTQQFFFVNRTVEVLLGLARVDIFSGHEANCCVKLSGVQYIMESTDEVAIDNASSTLPAIETANPVCKDDDNEYFLSTPVQPSRRFARPAASGLADSPSFEVRKSSLLRGILCSKKCECNKCQHIILHRLRAEFFLVFHEMDKKLLSSSDSIKRVVRQAEALSEAETSLLLKVGRGDVPPSCIDISICWMLSRLIMACHEGCESEVAFNVMKMVKKKLDTLEHVGDLHFLRATLTYQQCLSRLLLQASKEETSVSRMLSSMWSCTNLIRPATAQHETLSDLDGRMNSLQIGDNMEMKTPQCKRSGSQNKSRPLFSKANTTGFVCAAPVKNKESLSVFNYYFSSEEEDECVLASSSSFGVSSKDFQNDQTAREVKADKENNDVESTKRSSQRQLDAPDVDLQIKTPKCRQRLKQKPTSDHDDLHATPGEGTRKMRSCRKVFKPEASSECEVEMTRGGSPKEFGLKKRKDARAKKACRPNEPCVGEKPFCLETIVDDLEEVRRQVEHHPRVPLYGDLNLLLALCKGDGDPATVGHLLESVGITFRHYTSVRLARLRDAVDDGATPESSSMLESRLNVLSMQEGSLLLKNMTQFHHVTDKLPKDWVVCQINALPSYLSRGAKNPVLIVTRLENSQQPVTIQIASLDATSGTRSFISEFDEILSEKKMKMRISVSRQWWDTRKSLDNRLKSLLQSMEDVWFGPMKFILLGKRRDKTQQQLLESILQRICCNLEALGIENANRYLLELVVDAWPYMTWKQSLPAFAMACKIDVTDSRLGEMCSMVQSVSAELLNGKVARQVVVLILDKVIHSLPWENLPILRRNPVTRMPSLHSLFGHLVVHSNVQRQLPLVDTKMAYYILNPSCDLARTQETFKDFFHSLKWPGITGRPPTKDEWATALNSRDLFVYCGHGAGSKYAVGDSIVQRFCRATTILMGCSSAVMRNQGPNLEPYGVLLQYIAAGCPCLIGNLWDVTDKDIDRLLEALLRAWLPGKSHNDASLLQNLAAARDATVLNHLIGAAPVAYGIPVFVCDKS